MKFEQMTSFPLWIEYSGLPEFVNSKVRGGAAWPVFKKIAELDCGANAEPDTVEIPLTELARLCGVESAAARKAILAMRKLKLVSCFLPESDEEAALLKIRIPLPTPQTIEQIKAAHPRIFMETAQRFRYADEWDAETGELSAAADPVLQEIVDLYFNAVGLKMNAFILDELRLLRTKFPPDQVRRTFRRAQQNEIRSLHWVVRELLRQKKKQDEKDSQND